jgi:hypothetical protein
VSYRLSFQVEAELLRVEVWGDRGEGDLVADARGVWTSVATVCGERDLSRILLISHATGDYPIGNGYRINSTLQECGVQRSWRVAFVNLDRRSFRDVKFGETVARNRGFSVKVFSNEDEARAWL